MPEDEGGHMSRPVAINVDRLFAAADMLLSAIGSAEGMHSLIEMAPGTTPRERAEGFEPFTHPELLEAMSMLTRMGYLEDHRHPRVP
jgi:hypothetical protein